MPRARRVPFLSPAVWAFVCALAFRLVLPAGIMPAAGPDGPTIMLCSGMGVYEVVIGPDGKPTPARPHPGHQDHGACPFAGGHAYVPPAQPATPTLTAYSWRIGATAPPCARAGALELCAPPPPSHAPPPRPA